jgi:hypothetical protein
MVSNRQNAVEVDTHNFWGWSGKVRLSRREERRSVGRLSVAHTLDREEVQAWEMVSKHTKCSQGHTHHWFGRERDISSCRGLFPSLAPLSFISLQNLKQQAARVKNTEQVRPSTACPHCRYDDACLGRHRWRTGKPRITHPRSQ